MSHLALLKVEMPMPALWASKASLAVSVFDYREFQKMLLTDTFFD